MSKRDNILEQIRKAEAKLQSIDNNIIQLEKKQKNLQKAINDQNAKKQKIQFFLEKAKETISN